MQNTEITIVKYYSRGKKSKYMGILFGGNRKSRKTHLFGL